MPASSPSFFTTYGGPKAFNAISASALLVHRYDWAVGAPACAMTSLANALDPSIWAAAADGPKQATPAARTASATPATNGASGPTTTRSTRSSTASWATADGSRGSTTNSCATVAIPGLPGAAR